MHAAHEIAARARYGGIAPPPAPPVPRTHADIAFDMRAACEALADLAAEFEFQVRPIKLATADALATGIGRLLAELRQGSRA